MNQPLLHRLIYRSRQSPVIDGDLDYALGEIVRKSIANNRADDVTGLLLAVQGFFVQALEGRREVLERIYARISADGRHYDVAMISSRPAEARLFGEWNMCARSMGPADEAILDVLDARGAFDAARLTPDSALKLLTTVAGIQRRTVRAAMSA